MGLTVLFFVLGFALLVKGADLLVDGSSEIARKFRVSNLVIGLTIVSFGTSVPEMVVNLFASVQGNTDLAIANIVGSNIVNLLLILGVSSVIYPLYVSKGTVWREIPFSLLAALVLLILVNDQALSASVVFSGLGREDGLVLLALFAVFLYYIFGMVKQDRKKETGSEKPGMSMWRAGAWVGLGLVGLFLGGNWVVESSVKIASALGVSQFFIGLTVIAIGTSLPELVTSAVAAYKKKTDIAIANVIGSGIFNIFWILGISAFIRPLPFDASMNLDIGVIILATALLFIWMFIGKKRLLERWQGASFIFFYVLYIILIALRG